MPTQTPFPPPFFLSSAGIYFDESAVAGVANGVSGAEILSIRVPDRRVAILLDVGVDAGQLSGWWWGTFYLELNGSRDPSFTRIQGMVARFVEPAPCYRVAKPGSFMRVLVDNGAPILVTLQYAARLRGFFVDETALPEWDARDLRG